ncbi:hypothetical protein SADUNF_Sadunf10G0182200 [Salix dunnii]|uniref:Uncharacterized protein n=1 Tax=Salix dunnii TaxID=1413687 RepID=A0A835MQA1_9ROSI|nr:hypothetical protein SADUNF_Sadunf10G0182200 [Salix dunnii]
MVSASPLNNSLKKLKELLNLSDNIQKPASTIEHCTVQQRETKYRKTPRRNTKLSKKSDEDENKESRHERVLKSSNKNSKSNNEKLPKNLNTSPGQQTS